MVTETKQLIPLMLIDDKSRYITHESNEAELKAAASELGECLKKAMLDCYANNTLIKEAYISNIQKYISEAKHEITFEPNMEVTLVDQYGRAWSEVKSNSKEVLTTRPINLGNNIPAILDIHNLQKNEDKSISEEQLSESECQEIYTDIVEHGETEDDLSEFKKYVEEHGSWLTQEEQEALYEWWKEEHPEIKWWQYIPMFILWPLTLLTGCSIQKEPAPELKSHKTEDETETETKPELDYKVYVTAEQMEKFGWSLSADELRRLNIVLDYYGITDIRSIRLFLATCAHESGKGENATELGGEEYYSDKSYDVDQRGAGYMQLTKIENQEAFLKTVPQLCEDLSKKIALVPLSKLSEYDGYVSYIAENYPWESAAWAWATTSVASTGVGSMNNYVTEYGASKNIFLITQYYINGWKDGLTDKILRNIRLNKVEWEIKNHRLFVNGQDVCDEPNGWSYNGKNKNYREAVYEEAKAVFN